MSPSEAKGPAVSVVISTHGRETRLAFALEALAQQTLPSSEFEVVVVRSRGAEGPFAIAPEGLDVRFFEFHGEPTRPAKRNHGWRQARGELIAFTDDDCRPDPGWLQALLAGGARRQVLQGRTEPDPDERHLLHGLARSVEVVGPSAWFQTCNLALPRSLLVELGGFDEAFVATGEDTDLGLRAQAAGVPHRYVEPALVHHAVLPRPLQLAVQEGWRHWDTTPLLFRRHPQLRRHLVAGFFFNRSHAALALLLAGVLLGRRRPAIALAAAAPFAAEGFHVREVSPRRLLRHLVHLPGRLLSEAAVAAGLFRGGIRHRAPMF